MTSSKFSVSRATRSTLYSLSSPFHKSSSNISDIFDRSHKRDSAASASSSKDSSVDSTETPAVAAPPTTKPKPEPAHSEPATPRRDAVGLRAVPQDDDHEEDEHKGNEEEEDHRENRDHVRQPLSAQDPGEDIDHTPGWSREDHPAAAAAAPQIATTTTDSPSASQNLVAVTSPAGGVAASPSRKEQKHQKKLAKDQQAPAAEEPVLRPRPSPRKSRTWAGRLSTFLPALISPTADTPQHSPSIHRKPLPNPASNNSSPTDPANPPHGLGIRSSATFDTAFMPSNTSDPHHQQSSLESSAPQYAPPPPPPQAYGREQAARPQSWAPRAPIPPPKLADDNNEMLAMPLREAPGPPQMSVETERQGGGRLKKERRHSPPAANPVEQITPPSPETTLTPGKLRKENTESRQRSASVQQGNRRPSFPLFGRATSPSPAPDPRGRRSTSAQPPGAQEGPRVVSGSHSAGVSQSPNRDDKRGRLRRSWMPGGRSRSNSHDMGQAQNAQAWVLGTDPAGDYKTSFLIGGEKVPELWNDSGSVLVHLFPRNAGFGPSFKVPVYAVSSSKVFSDLIQAELTPGGDGGGRSRARSFTGRNSLSVEDAARIPQYTSSGSPPLDGTESPGDVRLYIPVPSNPQLATPGQRAQDQAIDFERLIAIRNLFAFLTGQPMVGTKAYPTVFTAFLQMSALLVEFEFSNIDGSTFGEAVDMSFDFFNNNLAMSDVRHSREKTIESLILGERMRSLDLYNEAFAHAVGKYTAIMDLRSPLLEMVTPQTRQKLERAHLDLIGRQHSVNNKLEQFQFPSLFSGIANSSSIDEVKSVRFDKWRTSYNKMRQFVLSYYKSTFGNWPPKASSKKNPFSESGLNRLVLKALYSDMCAMYDLLVDRDSLTPRVNDGGVDDESSPDAALISALRKVLVEFDSSTPPVLPPIPFDAPQLPSMRTILETYDKMNTKDKLKFDKRIKEHELILILHKAYNYDTNTLKIPFLAAFKDFENHEARGKTAADMADQRIGYWLFLYVVIQSLPMLVVDAPNLKHTEGVEYFLCEPPMGNPPWLEDTQVKKMWYEVSGGAGGFVELSADSVTFSVEAIYHRSHCWAAAKIWEQSGLDEMAPIATEPVMSPLAPPPMFLDQDGSMPSPPSLPAADPSPPPGSPKYVGRPRNNSPGGRALASRNSAYRSSIAIGLEPVPMGGMSDLPGDRSSRIGSVGGSMTDLRLPSRGGLPSNGSATNLAGQAPPPMPEAATSTMTFDDILGGTQPAKTKKKKSKFF
ncbi:hypothetical protein F5X68DRAFT_205094 [Plectosphaerella plurivora]|uniref:DUF8004 domain-containing protein n=1 Tax=Plectosphaerella plurivora TaxID=936078 RepID=A0A9P8VF65_9PEZI|nr:hypothetical protein F5X68DRAFT_205094 [Plectosphaerella plurivora]